MSNSRNAWKGINIFVSSEDDPHTIDKDEELPSNNRGNGGQIRNPFGDIYEDGDNVRRTSINDNAETDSLHLNYRQDSGGSPISASSPVTIRSNFKSYDKSQVSSPAVEKKSFIEEATERNDFEALKEGLNFALGDSKQDGNWFPVLNNPQEQTHSSISEYSPTEENDLAGYIDSIELGNLTNKGKDNSNDIHPSFHGNHIIETNEIDPDNSSFENFVDLESKRFSVNYKDFPSSPAKFTDAITRISDRIVGNKTHSTSGVSNSSQPDDSPSKRSTKANMGSGGSNTSFNDKISSINRNSFYRVDHSHLTMGDEVIVDNIPKIITDNAEISEQTINGESKQNVLSGGLGLYLQTPSSQNTIHKNDDSEEAQSTDGSVLNTTSSKNRQNPQKDFNNVRNYTEIRYIFGKSLKCFSPESKIRQKCYKIADHKNTNSVLLFLLILQVAILSYRQWNPYHYDGYYFKGYNWADYILIVINIIYTAEIIVKVIAFGFYDDRCLFEELKISYPEHRIKFKFYKPSYLLRIISLIKSKKFSKNMPSGGNKYQEYEESESQKLVSGSDEDQYQDATFHAKDRSNKYQIYQPNIIADRNVLENKYGSLKSHHAERREPESELSTEKMHNKKIQKTKNTFLLSSTANIENLHIRRAYIRRSWNRIDFLSMVSFWISLLISVNRYDGKHHIMLFRALSCLRILRLCNLTKGTSTILAACKSALPQLMDVSLFICCFWLFFGIIGVQSFKSSLTRHCVWYNPSDPSDYYLNDDQYCGSYIGLDGSAQPYITRDGDSSGIIKGFRCPRNSRCISGDNPYGGTVNFDNIFQSLQMVFVVMSANTFTDIMYDTMDSDNLGACLFYIFSIFILTVWLINIFIAVIVTSFDIARMEAAEKKKNKSERVKIHNIFGISDKQYMSNKEKLAKLKKSSRLLKYYYQFEFIFIILILFDLFSQCFRSYNMDNSTRIKLSKIETSFTLIFFLEIIIRFLLHLPSWRSFFFSKKNNFDLFLAIITFITVISPIKKKLGQAYYWLTIFQLMRFYRAVLSTKITSTLWLKIMGNIKSIFDLALFFFILTFLTSVILSRYFEGAIPRDSIDDLDFPLHTLPNTFIGLYVITSTENWTDILYGFQQYASTTSYRVFGAIFIVGWFIISNMIILNIFIALTAKTLEVPERDKRKQQLLQFINKMTERLDNLDSDSRVLSKFKNKIFKTKGVNEKLEKAVVNLLLSGTAINDFIVDYSNDSTDVIDDHNIKTLPSSGWKRWLQVNYWRTYDFIKNPFYTKKKSTSLVSNDFDPAVFAKTIITERNILISKQNTFLKENPRFNNVFYIIGPRHWLRRICQRLVGPSYGERIDGVLPSKLVGEIFVVVVFLASIALVITACILTPLLRQSVSDKYGSRNWTLDLEISFVVFFSLEFVIKILADGLLFTPNAYMRSVWNNIDLIVLISIWIELIAFLKSNGSLSRIVRGLKALRALRLLTISETARNTFHNTIFSGFYKIVNASIISLCLLFPFSIWALNVLNGRLGYCLDGESYDYECFNEYSNEVFNWDILSPNVYTNPYLEFDSFSKSFSSLFQIISLEGWVDLLLNAMNSTGIGSPPQSFASPINGFLIVLFNFTSIVFILTLFVSVIIHNYSETTGTAYMTDEQISWYHVRKFLSQVKPSKRKSYYELSWLKRFCYKLVIEKNPIWNNTLGFFLFLHVLALLLESYPSYDGLLYFRNTIFIIVSFLHVLDSLMFLSAMGFRTIFKYKYLFNVIVSVGSFSTTIIGFNVNSSSVFMNINKLFLVGMLSFIIPKSNRLSQLLKFTSASLPSLISLAFTWVIIFLVYAIAMNQIFGMTKVGPNGTGNLNLRSVPKALILLFKCSFGEGWNYIMDDYALEAPYCTLGNDVDDSDCGNKQYAYILFISWNIISMYIFVNMFISLILDTFSYINYSSSYGDFLKREEIRKFKVSWQKFDPEGTGYIKPASLPKFLRSLEGSISFRLYHGELEIPELCNQWIVRHDPNNPYDISVKYDAIERTLNSINVSKIRSRRKLFEKFIEEAFLSMELNNDPGISFTNVLLQIPLYLSFEAGSCLNLIDFLERRLLMQKVEKRLQVKKAHESIAAYACRWKYVENRRKGIKDTEIDFGRELRRNSYLQPSPKHKIPSINTKISYSISDKSDDYKPYMDEVELDISKPSGNATSVYIPKSPLYIYKTNFPDSSSNSTPTTSHPRLHIQIPNSNPNYKNISPGYEKLSPLLSAESIGDDNSSYVGLREIGKTLEDSSWGTALKDVQSANRSEFSETDKEK